MADDTSSGAATLGTSGFSCSKSLNGGSTWLGNIADNLPGTNHQGWYSGVAKAYRPDAGFLLVMPDGTSRPLPKEAATANLVPGGTLLYQFQYQPATVRIPPVS